MTTLALLQADIWREIGNKLLVPHILRLLQCGDRALFSMLRRTNFESLGIDFDPTRHWASEFEVLKLLKVHSIDIECDAQYTLRVLDVCLPNACASHLRSIAIPGLFCSRIDFMTIPRSTWEAVGRFNLTKLEMMSPLTADIPLPASLTTLKVVFETLSDLKERVLPPRIETLHIHVLAHEIGDIADSMNFIGTALPSLLDLGLSIAIGYPDGDPETQVLLKPSMPCLRQFKLDVFFHDAHYYYNPVFDFTSWCADLASVSIKCDAEYRLLLPSTGTWACLTIEYSCFNALDLIRGHGVPPEFYSALRELTLISQPFLATALLEFPPNLRNLTLKNCEMTYQSLGIRQYNVLWSYPFFPYYKLPARLERLKIQTERGYRLNSDAAESTFVSFGDVVAPERVDRPDRYSFRMDKYSCNNQCLPCHDTLKTLILDGPIASISRSAFGFLPSSLTYLQANSPLMLEKSENTPDWSSQLSMDGIWTPQLLADLFTGRLVLTTDRPALNFRNLAVLDLRKAIWYPLQESTPSEQCRSEFYHALEGGQIKRTIEADWIAHRIASGNWKLPRSI